MPRGKRVSSSDAPSSTQESASSTDESKVSSPKTIDSVTVSPESCEHNRILIDLDKHRRIQRSCRICGAILAYNRKNELVVVRSP
jgi:hypothetical protein